MVNIKYRVFLAGSDDDHHHHDGRILLVNYLKYDRRRQSPRVGTLTYCVNMQNVVRTESDHRIITRTYYLYRVVAMTPSSRSIRTFSAIFPKSIRTWGQDKDIQELNNRSTPVQNFHFYRWLSGSYIALLQRFTIRRLWMYDFRLLFWPSDLVGFSINNTGRVHFDSYRNTPSSSCSAIIRYEYFVLNGTEKK